ncbi:hypothetical protein [Prauserella muralis]|uniref:Uncharacterized protein n=1 Tax=Prauserella muralis TaxID=588067 RepID=A0A2V4BBU5_9PSEU|nr:hypothetical protein [Prauserella muralis]PXY31519.1 hypothetical protein BAY60_03855 [Prauserella muralis]TWE14132.1 hypothetical protein FHX69_6269 [Prauserella muralis]
MENTAIDYLSFVRGFLAATDTPAGAQDTVSPAPGAAVDPDSYAAGYAAGCRCGNVPVTRYRELSVRDDGRFTGTLDLTDLAPLPGAAAADEPPVLSGTLDLGF